MFPALLLRIVLLPLIHSIPTLQVDIHLTWYHAITPAIYPNLDPWFASCLNIAPGVCCKPHEEVILPSPESLLDYEGNDVSFEGLLSQQMGAGWAATTPRYDGIACAGAPLFRLFGPTHGAVHQYYPEGVLRPTPADLVFSASWVDLRVRFPPDSAASRYLQFQGVKRMVWGLGSWSSESDGVPFPKRKRDREQRRLNGWAEKGEVRIATPPRWRYPSLYTVNGTNYRDGGDGVFRSEDGRVFNLTNGIAR